MQRLIALLGWLSFAIWLLSSPGCGGLEEGWRLEGIPEEPAAAALVEWCSAGYCDTLNSSGVNVIQLDQKQDGTKWLGISDTYSTNGTHRIRIAYTVPADRLRVLLLHELGHAFRGHGHLPPGNVMARYLDDCAEHLTETDISGTWGEP
jgi:hypothetical protein